MTAKRKQFVLDNALRHLYYAIGYRRCPIVAIEFEHRGKKYRADTPKEAAELQFLLGQKDATDGSYSPNYPKAWSADQAMELLEGVGEAQKKFLALLVNGGKRQSTALVEGIGLDSEIALAGVVSGLTKQLRKMGMNPHEVYRVEVNWKGKSKARYFQLLDALRDALVDLGFPEAWEEKDKRK